MALTMIVARATNGVIGRAGSIPWHLPKDLRRFKALTMGQPMIMGRRTFDSLPGILPGRRHIVLTRDPDWRRDGVDVVHCVDDALTRAGEGASVIGGAAIFAAFEPHASRWELTHVHGHPAGDVTMPPPDPARWAEVARERHDGFDFITLVRRSH